jgi:hypothetical protein
MNMFVGKDNETEISVECEDGYVQFDVECEAGDFALDLSHKEAIELGMRLIQSGEKAKKIMEAYSA